MSADSYHTMVTNADGTSFTVAGDGVAVESESKQYHDAADLTPKEHAAPVAVDAEPTG